MEDSIPEPLLERTELQLQKARVLIQNNNAADGVRIAHRFLRQGISDQMLAAFAAQLIITGLQRSLWEDPVDVIPVPVTDRAELLVLVDLALHELLGAKLPSRLSRKVMDIAAAFYVLTSDDEAFSSLKPELSRAQQDEKKLFEESVALAKHGDGKASFNKLPPSQHPWKRRWQTAVVLEEAGHADGALKELFSIQQDYPGRAPVEFDLARFLASAGQAQAAVPHARAAFDALPGKGQRLMLVRCLMASGAVAETGALLAPLMDGASPEVLRLHAYWAEKMAPDTAPRCWENYLAARPDDLIAQMRLAEFLWNSGSHDNAANRAWVAFERDTQQSLPAKSLHAVAVLQMLAFGEASDSKVRDVAAALATRVDRDPAADVLYFDLFLRMENRDGLRPPDFGRLREAGFLFPVAKDTLVASLRNEHERQRHVRELYAAGQISFERYLGHLGTKVAHYVVLSEAGKERIATPVGPADELDDELRGRRVLVSDLELHLLLRFELLDSLRQGIGRVVIFQDVLARINAAPVELLQYQQKRVHHQLADLRQLLTDEAAVHIEKGPIEGTDEHLAQELGHTWFGSSDPDKHTVSALITRMRQDGLILPEPAARVLQVLPPAGPPLQAIPRSIALPLPALLALHSQGLVKAVATTAERGLWVGPATFNSLKEKIRAHELAAVALSDATRVQEFVGRGLFEGWVEPIARPNVAELGVPENASQDEARDELEQAMTWGEALAKDSSLYLLSADFMVTSLFTGASPMNLFKAVIRKRDVYLRFAERMREVAAREISFSRVVVRLAESPRADDLMLKMVHLGFQQAFSPSGLVALASRFGRLDEGIPAAAIKGLQSRAKAEPGLLLARLGLAHLYARAIWTAWTSDDVSEEIRHRLTTTLLDSAEDLGAEDPNNGLDITLRLVAAGTISYPKHSFSRRDDNTAVLDPDAPAGRLWRTIFDWAKRTGVRRNSYRRAVVDAALTLDSLHPHPNTPPAPLALALCHPFLSLEGEVGLFPTGPEAETLAILTTTWRHKPLETLATTIKDHSTGQVFQVQPAEILRRSSQLSATEFAQMTRQMRVHFGFEAMPGRPLEAVVPAEVVLLEMPEAVSPGAARFLSASYVVHDGVVGGLLQDIAKHPRSEELRREFARAAARSPWREIRSDPLHLITWGSTLRSHESFPNSAEDLRLLLSEPGPLGPKSIAEQICDRLDEGGCWRDSANPYDVTNVATQQPGDLPIYLLTSRLQDDAIASEVSNAFRALEDSSEISMGQLSTCVYVLRAAADIQPASGSPAGDIDLKAKLPALLTRLLLKEIDAPPEGSLAFAESGMLRICNRAVLTMSLGTLSDRDQIWLTYRLYGWWVLQLNNLSPEIRREHLLRIQRTGDRIAKPGPARRDMLDPERFASDNIRHRLLTLLHALVAMEPATRKALPESPTVLYPRWLLTDEMRQVLLGLAVQEPTEVETTIRQYEPPSALPWSGPRTVPEAALCALLRFDHEAWLDLEPAIRLRWLCYLLPDDDATAVEAARWAVASILVATSLHGAELTQAERMLLAKRLRSRTSYLQLGPARLMTLMQLCFVGELDSGVISAIRDDVLSGENHIHEALGPFLADVSERNPGVFADMARMLVSETLGSLADPTPLLDDLQAFSAHGSLKGAEIILGLVTHLQSSIPHTEKLLTLLRDRISTSKHD
jgi:hypothetical protein